jgi:hypothetical protein
VSVMDTKICSAQLAGILSSGQMGVNRHEGKFCLLQTLSSVPIVCGMRVRVTEILDYWTNELHGAASFLRSSATPDILQILWNPNSCYQDHNSPPLIPVLNPMNSVHTATHCFFKIHLNIILASTSMFSKWSPPFRHSD